MNNIPHKIIVQYGDSKSVQYATPWDATIAILDLLTAEQLGRLKLTAIPDIQREKQGIRTTPRKDV